MSEMKGTMESVSIKEFQRNIYLYLKQMPLEVTRNGEVFFYVVPPKKKDLKQQTLLGNS